MKKIKENIYGFLRELNKVLPIGWVLACYDIGADQMFKQPLHDLFVLFCSCVIAYILLFIGKIADEAQEKTDASPISVFLVLFVLLLIITGWWNNAVSRPPNV